MDFGNKMDFLIRLSQIKNKELAAEMSVDRSLISLLRTGKRGMPKNKLHINHMAESFAKRITTDIQRQALAEVTGFPGLRTEVSPEILALQLQHWLMGDIDIVEHILDGIEQDISYSAELNMPSYFPSSEETLFFYGDSGKREAFRYIISIIKEGMVGVFDNTDLSWAYSDPSFSAEIQALIKTKIQNDSTFTQILPPISNINCYTDSLRFLLPIYTRGNVNVYYYPRINNVPQNMMLIVAPGQCVSYSYALCPGSKNMITVVSKNKDLINAHAEQFREYLATCKSALEVHKKVEEFINNVSDFLSLSGDICQKTLPLSTSSMSVELALMFADQCEDAVWKESFLIFSKNIPLFEKRLEVFTHIDICPLNTVKDIVGGKVPVACPYMPSDNHPCYTPETYILHLNNIIRLMDTYKGYYFIPISPKSYPN